MKVWYLGLDPDPGSDLVKKMVKPTTLAKQQENVHLVCTFRIVELVAQSLCT